MKYIILAALLTTFAFVAWLALLDIGIHCIKDIWETIKEGNEK